MKSYKDKQLVFGLLFLSIAAGVTGHFFETEHLSFQNAANLNEASAILATQQNIVGEKSGVPADAITLGFSDSAPVVADISFARSADCGPSMSIKTMNDRTVGFLCLASSDPDFDAKVRTASSEVNALVVSPKFDAKETGARETAIARAAIQDGAAFVVGAGTTASAAVDDYNGSSIVYSLGTGAAKSPGISVTAELSGSKVTDIVLQAK